MVLFYSSETTMAEQEQSLCYCRYQRCCWNIRLILRLHQLRLPLTSVQIFFIHLHVKSSLPFCSFSAILLKLRTPEILEILFFSIQCCAGSQFKSLYQGQCIMFSACNCTFFGLCEGKTSETWHAVISFYIFTWFNLPSTFIGTG